LPSDGSTDTENSGEEVEVTKNLGKEMSDQPVVGKNTKKHGNKTQPLEEIISQLTKKVTADQVGETQTDEKTNKNQVQRKKKTMVRMTGKIKRKPAKLSPTKATRSRRTRLVIHDWRTRKYKNQVE
jgi:hypothetical protein